MALRCFARRALIPSVPARRRAAVQPAQSALHTSSISCNADGKRANTDVFAESSLNSKPTLPSHQKSLRYEPVEVPEHSSNSFFNSFRVGPAQSAPDQVPPREPKRPMTYEGGKHPLVKELLSALFSTGQRPSPERVWNAYNDVAAYRGDEGTGTEVHSSSGPQLMANLNAEFHRLVLRALAPDVLQEREARRNYRRQRSAENRVSAPEPTESTSTSADAMMAERGVLPVLGRRSAPSATRSPFDGSSRSVKEYLRRVQVVLDQMRQCRDPHGRPSISDYNHVLAKLAPGGHLPHMWKLWDEITAALPTAPASGPKPASDSMLMPTRATYHALMLGLSKGLEENMVRSQKAYDMSLLRGGSPKARFRTKNGSVETVAAAWNDKRIATEELAPRARHIAQRAAEKAVELLDDMWARGVRPNSLTFDLAARLLRLAGNLTGARTLLRAAYNVDLTFPDARTPEMIEHDERLARGAMRSGQEADIAVDGFGGKPASGRPSVHTLNTLLMAFGEQGTVPEMATVYEVLSRPLPNRNASGAHARSTEASEQIDSLVQEQTGNNRDMGNMFSLNWRDIAGVDSSSSEGRLETQPEAEQTVGPSAMTYSHPDAVHPNTTTFTLLLKHACAAPDVSAKPSSAVSLSNGSQMNAEQRATQKKSERAARTRGAYTLIAQYVLREALERYEAEVFRVAGSLGVNARQLRMELDQEEALAGRDDVEGPETEEGGHALVASGPSPEIPTEPPTAIFNPPRLRITSEMVYPLVSLASRAQSPPLLRWVREQLGRAARVTRLEAAVFVAAADAFSRSSTSAPSTETSGLNVDAETRAGDQAEARAALLSSFQKQLALIHAAHADLSLLIDERISNRLHTLSGRRRAHSERRHARALLKTQKEEEEQKLHETKAAEKKASAKKRWSEAQGQERKEGAEENKREQEHEMGHHSLSQPAVAA